jgi:hypothetical protein
MCDEKDVIVEMKEKVMKEKARAGKPGASTYLRSKLVG